MTDPTTPATRGWRVRLAVPADLGDVDRLVRELAVYEREPDAVEATPDDFATALFGPDPRAYCHVAQLDDGRVVGIAVWYETFSTWKGRHGIWLEDLFVSPEHRGLGLGKALLGELAAECLRRGYPRLEWWVLNWNAPSIAFYDSLGALPQDEWTVYRLTDEALTRTAGSAAAPPASGTSVDGR